MRFFSRASVEGSVQTVLRCAASRRKTPCLAVLRAYRTLGVVLMSPRIAKVYEHTIAHVLRHKSVQAVDNIVDTFVIGGNDVAQVFRVHARGECRRADQVGEQYGDLATLGGVLRLLFDAADGFGY
jgi:hypothetical protein